jgi:hypothetical protein
MKITQIKIKKLVRTKKKIEIPSIPKEKDKFRSCEPIGKAITF